MKMEITALFANTGSRAIYLSWLICSFHKRDNVNDDYILIAGAMCAGGIRG